jgi:poly-gamma-glutamate synthesis protein (capsule biosynthesis protein)
MAPTPFHPVQSSRRAFVFVALALAGIVLVACQDPSESATQEAGSAGTAGSATPDPVAAPSVSTKSQPPLATPSSSQTASRVPGVKAISARLLFTGNVFWGRYMNDWSQASDLGTAYPFSRLGEFDRDGYDAWISGLECPTVPGIAPTSAEQEAALAFNCSPEYLPEAARWFTAFSLGNNHTDNQGADGFAATKTELAKAGIQYFGHYDPNTLDEVCGTVIVPARIAYDDGTSARGELPLAMCAHHGVFGIPSAASLDQISRYASHLPVIALPHMGAEYQPAPDQIKRDTYRAMVERGADMVLGDHPHWVQSAEVYQDKLIVYSMGNFMFDQQYNAEVTRSAAIEVRLMAAPPRPATSGAASSLAGWLELAAVCRDGLDACVAAADAAGLERLDLDYEFAVVGTANNERLTRPATPVEQAGIEERLGWARLELPGSDTRSDG